MARFTLYGVHVSAFVAKVRIVLDLKELDYEELPPPGGYGSAEYRKIVPAGSVPGLLADGAALSDSNAIVEYLEEIAPRPRLAPDTPVDRARMRALMGYHDTRVEAAARAMFPLIKRDWRAERGTVEEAAAGVECALSRLSDMIDPRPYLFGEAVTLADCAFPATLQMARMMAAEMERKLAIPAKVAALEGALAEVPAVRRTLSIHRAAMEDWMAGYAR